MRVWSLSNLTLCLRPEFAQCSAQAEQDTIETRFKQKSRIIDTGVDSYLVPWDDGAG